MRAAELGVGPDVVVVAIVPAGVSERTTTSPSANSPSHLHAELDHPGRRVVVHEHVVTGREARLAHERPHLVERGSEPLPDVGGGDVLPHRGDAPRADGGENDLVLHGGSLPLDRARRGARGALYPKPT